MLRRILIIYGSVDTCFNKKNILDTGVNVTIDIKYFDYFAKLSIQGYEILIISVT